MNERQPMHPPVAANRQRRRFVALAAFVLVATVVAVGAIGGGGSGPEESALPEATFELFDGEQATFADFAGQPMVVNFWASWCPACVAELPEFQAAFEEYGNRVVFLGLANADARDAANRLASQAGLTYTLADDPSGELFRSFELIAMPSTVFITADGEIEEVFGGQLNERALGERIENLIGAA